METYGQFGFNMFFAHSTYMYTENSKKKNVTWLNL